eukprot:TRINITY_DN8866_c0_g1_i1.p1 TRINITY_DN8866_c0_g1~~TRINITY_DN8866_c0_g1_i1.p1  ORF type:complete len:380 (-),score=64.94 TRINITY_DN8866_c0_g1_i1:136-1233(-)
MSQRMVIALVGLPGCGKTTIAKDLARHLSASWSVTVLSADQIYHELASSPTCLDRELSPFPEIVQNEDVDVDLDSRFAGFDQARWRQSQWELKIRTRAWLTRSDPIDAGKQSPLFSLLILDDNHHMRERRRQWARLCLSHECLYAQIAIICSIDQVLHRNSQREGVAKVPIESIMEMNRMFQWPEAAIYPWEVHTAQIDSSSRSIDSSIPAWDDPITILLHTIRTWSLIPPEQDPYHQYHITLQQAQECSRTSNHQSLGHNLDLLLRKWIAHMASLLKQASGPVLDRSHDISQNMKSLNNIRKQVLAQVRLDANQFACLVESTEYIHVQNARMLFPLLLPKSPANPELHELLIFWLARALALHER